MLKPRHSLEYNQAQVKALVVTPEYVPGGLVLLGLTLTGFFYFFSFGMILLWRALTGG